MKKLLLIPAMCLLCFACSHNDSSCKCGIQTHKNSPDWEITTKVKTEIMADVSISASARFVSVSTTAGVVTLTGSVPTKQDREKIVKIAKGVSGVARVENQITISNS